MDHQPVVPIDFTVVDGPTPRPGCDQSRFNKQKLSQNPVLGMEIEDIIVDASEIHAKHVGDLVTREEFTKGALCMWAKESSASKDPKELKYLTQQDRSMLEMEAKSPLRYACSKKVFFAAAVVACCAIVQGMDQTIINGAQVFYFAQFGITNPSLKGFVNGAPYIIAFLSGAFLNPYLNNRMGRRGTIVIGCWICLITAVWQAISTSVWLLLLGRMALGLAVSPMSATVPMYCAEVSPAAVRGRLGMLWQTFTAFGILLGLATCLGLNGASFGISSHFGGDLQWRYMFGLTGVPPLIVLCMIPFAVESPRYFISKGEYTKAFIAFRELRNNDLAASRDFYAVYKSHEVEVVATSGKSSFRMLRETIKFRRVWISMLSAYFVMLMQQFCGINAIAYYSTDMFMSFGYTRNDALLFSFGFGAINTVFALVAFLKIDTLGRRTLMLATLPCMTLCLVAVAVACEEGGKSGMILTTTWMYIFTALYSVGPGPVSFGYAAEVLPLQTKALLMATATSLTWLFNFLVSFSWPGLSQAFGTSGAFGLYATFCGIGFIIAFLFMRETKQLTLEEMDIMFNIPVRTFAADKLSQVKHKVTFSKRERTSIFEEARERARQADTIDEMSEASASGDLEKPVTTAVEQRV